MSRYGRRTVATVVHHDHYDLHRSHRRRHRRSWFSRRIRSTSELGATISTTTYIKARRELERLRRVVFSDLDLVLAPTAYLTPPTIEQSAREPEGRTPLLPTIDFSIFGLPAISVPCGFTRLGLPIGLQIVGPRFGEPKVLAIFAGHPLDQAQP